ncbi:MAG: DNA polymerase III subunit beta [Candidatus Brocadia sp.]|nr:DNA polymerase III subunit beta [Candidatus Brocadia sp.]
MNIIFSGKDLYNSFNLVTGIVPSSTIKNVLRGVKVEVGNTCIKLTATDLEVLVKCFVPAKECVGDGSIVLPAIRVNNILREWAKHDEVIMSVEDSSCMLKSRGGHFKIAGEDSVQFPDVTVTETNEFVEVDGAIIGDMIGKVVHSVSTVKTRSVLSGVFVRIFGDDIIMVAADGNRMSCIKRKVHNPAGVVMDGVVSVKCLLFMQRFVSECKGVLKVGMGESRICFIGERGGVVSQLIEGQYPKYEDIIPEKNERVVEVNKDDLLSGVRMASFMTSEGCRVVKFTITSGKLTLTSRAADVGEAELEIAASYEGPDFVIHFNPDYVTDVLKVSDGGTIVMMFNDGEGAAVFKTGYEQMDVIMPIEPK